MVYCEFMRWVGHHLGKRNRKVLPSCVVCDITDAFASEEYTGFKYPQYQIEGLVKSYSRVKGCWRQTTKIYDRLLLDQHRLPPRCGRGASWRLSAAGHFVSVVPVLSASKEGSTVTLCFAGPVPPEHVSMFQLQFWVRLTIPLMLHVVNADLSGKVPNLWELCGPSQFHYKLRKTMVFCNEI